jgi:hypothetical protein
VIIAGISGALLAVPFAACVNAAVKFLTGHETSPAEGKDTVKQALDYDYDYDDDADYDYDDDNDDDDDTRPPLTHPPLRRPGPAEARTGMPEARHPGTRRRRGARCGPSAAEGTS